MDTFIQDRLISLGLALPASPAPNGLYESVVLHRGIAYVSGQVSRAAAGVVAGPATCETSQTYFQAAAAACVLRALSALQARIGSLDSVERLLFVRGFVFAAPDFRNLSPVMDCASSLLHQIFGVRGQHARSAIGVASLPSGGMLEIEITAAIL